jgi:hypothetical protein
MTMKLQTRRFFKRQEIEILRRSLKIEKKSLLDYEEFEIPFENIHNKKTVQSKTNDNLMVISFTLFVIALLFFVFSAETALSTFLFFCGIFFLGIAFISRKKTVTIPTYNGDTIEIPFNNKNKADVLGFANKIIEASNSFLLNKYCKVDKALPLEGQIGKLDFLRDREILTDEEYDNLKNQLLGRENKGHLGFSR